MCFTATRLNRGWCPKFANHEGREVGPKVRTLRVVIVLSGDQDTTQNKEMGADARLADSRRPALN